MYGNVKLWFARDSESNIVTVNEVTDNNTYSCPVCGSDVIPKATKSKQVSSHFAHVDKTKCSSESMIHWWFKNKFLEVGDKFKITSDETREYMCKSIDVEVEHQAEHGIYRPDVTITTECGETIYFEMAFSNHKSVKDYLDMWLELGNIVVEVDIKNLTDQSDVLDFKALFYEGKCINIKRNDIYYNTIGRFKERMFIDGTNDELKSRIKKLDWFWDDVYKFNEGKIDIEHMYILIENIHPVERSIIDDILKKSICSDLNTRYLERKHLDQISEFDSHLSSDSNIKKAVKLLNRRFKQIDKNYKVNLHKEANYTYETNWHKGKKRRAKRVLGYTYSYFLLHSLYYDQGWAIESTNVTNRISKMKTAEEIFDYVFPKLEKHSILVSCKECNSSFWLESGEIQFYIENRLSYPKRCKACRTKRKLNKHKED